MDGGGLDAGTRDSGTPDAGPPGCRTDVECDDGDACDGLERCEEGRCVEGEAVVCPDDDVCDGSLACDPDTGECSVAIAPPTCAVDTDPCNGEEYCDPVAGCTSTPPPSCDDGIACTVDYCGDLGCKHEPDHGACTAMLEGLCVAGEGCTYPVCVLGVTCVAENPCQTATCDGDTCVRTALACPAGQMCCGGTCVAEGCDDRNVCTSDRCDPSAGCVHTPTSGTSCEDGDACTVSDRCESGTCRAGGPRCVSSDACRRATCDPSSGACGTAPAMDGSVCSDGNACTIGDACMGGTCHAGTGRPMCDDREPCTEDRCDANTGCESLPLPDGTTCGAGGTCRGGMCGPSACAEGTADCDANGTCECVGTCSVAGLCVVETGLCPAPCGPGEYCCGVMSSPDYGRCIGPDDACLGGTCCADLDS